MSRIESINQGIADPLWHIDSESDVIDQDDQEEYDDAWEDSGMNYWDFI